MDICVAVSAELDARCQVVPLYEGVSRRRDLWWKMAQQADRVNPRPIQQVRIRAAVRNMACGTTFGLDDRVFILEWPGHFGVALRADDVLLCGRALKLLSKAAVGLVTVGA